MIDGPDNQILPPGGRSSRYEIVRKIGEGGMGEVYLAHDPTLDRRVALKFLPPALEQNETARRRFLLEAKSAAALDHPYICKIYEIGDLDGRSFIAMEYVQGETLERRLRSGAVPSAEAVRLATEIVEALETAHGAGIVHRDLKPANIMITKSGHVKVMDFGLAKRIESPAGRETAFETAARLTGTGTMMGTPAYMSPEQMRAEELDTRSDTFSLGVVFYEMLTGAHPFAKSSAMDTIAAILSEDPPPLGRHGADLPEMLEHVVGKMTAKAPDERYQQIREVRIDLNRVRERIEDASVPLAPQTHSVGGGPKSRLLAAVGVVATVALLVVAAWWVNSMTSGAGSTGSETAAVAVVIVDEGPMLAVLPFRNLGADNDDDAFAEGISGSIAARLHGVGVRVKPSESVRIAYGDGSKLPDAVGRELGADLVLAGTLQFINENQVVVRLELIDSVTGNRTWNGEFQRSYNDFLKMTTEISTAAAVALEVELTPQAQGILSTSETDDLEALELYYEGARMMQLYSSPDDLEEFALPRFERALTFDDKLVEALIGIGSVRIAQWWAGGGSVEEVLEGRAYYERARAEDRSSMSAYRGLMVAHAQIGDDVAAAILLERFNAAATAREGDVGALLTMGVGSMYGEMSFLKADGLFRRAREIDAANVEAHYWGFLNASYLSATRAQVWADQYFALAPRDSEALMHLAMAYHVADDLDQAIALYEESIDPGEAGGVFADADTRLEPYIFGGAAYEQRGRGDDARRLWMRGLQAVDARIAASAGSPTLYTFKAALHGLLEQPDDMAESERRAFAEEIYPPWPTTIVAAVHAEREDPQRMMRLLDASKMAFPDVRIYKIIVGADPYENNDREMQRFVEEKEDAVRRLRQEYPLDYPLGHGEIRR